MSLVKIKQKDYEKMLHMRLEKIELNLRVGEKNVGLSLRNVLASQRLGATILNLKKRKEDTQKDIVLLSESDQEYMFVSMEQYCFVRDYIENGYSPNDGLYLVE